MAARRKARRAQRAQGAGNMSSKQMKKAMNQMDMEEISDVEEIIIRRKNEDMILKGAEVQIMKVSGQEIFTITPQSVERRMRETVKNQEDVKVNDEDIELIMGQANVDRQKAITALKEAGGDLATALMNLIS